MNEWFDGMQEAGVRIGRPIIQELIDQRRHEKEQLTKYDLIGN